MTEIDCKVALIERRILKLKKKIEEAQRYEGKIPIVDTKTINLKEKLKQLKKDKSLWEEEQKKEQLRFAIGKLRGKEVPKITVEPGSNNSLIYKFPIPSAHDTDKVITFNNTINGKSTTEKNKPTERAITEHKKDTPVRKIVSLIKTTETVFKKWNKNRKTNRLDICRKYLETHDIESKPNYPPEKLNNRVAQYIIKINNKESAAR